MLLWTASEAMAATGGQCRVPWDVQGISIDTRTLQPGDLFVALSAERDGHDFVTQALAKGAAAALVSHRPEGVSEEERSRKGKNAALPDGAVKYTVGVGDTLNSVALKHSMNVGLLKRCNKLLSPDLYPGQTLLVKLPEPQTPEQIRSATIREVMKGAGCTMPEATYYLDEYGGGVDAKAALAAHTADAQGGVEFEDAWLGRGL